MDTKIHRNGLWARPDEGDALLGTPPRKGAVLAEEAIARVDAVHLLLLCKLYDAL